MTEPTDLGVTPAYTRQAVDDYLQDVARQRAELEAAIAQARARTARSLDLERRITALEQRVGEWIVGAHVHTTAQPEPVFTGTLLPSAGGTPPSESGPGRTAAGRPTGDVDRHGPESSDISSPGGRREADGA